MNEEDDEDDDEKNAFLDQIKSEVLIIFFIFINIWKLDG